MPLQLFFLNVGHGDCTIIKHPSGRISMIDINNSKTLPDSDVDALSEGLGITTEAFRTKVGILTKAYFGRSAPPDGFDTWEDYYRSFLVDPVDFFTTTFGPSPSVWRYIQTHPDMDHMSGLCRLFWQEGIDLGVMWDTGHTKTMDEATFDKSRYEWADWLVYDAMRLGLRKDGATHRVLKLQRGAAAQFYDDDHIEILAPTQDVVSNANATENWNNHSYVLRVTHAGRSVILPGDAEKPVWDKIETFEPPGLACDILKASHHGRKSGYSETAVSEIDPSYVICSVGKKPSTDASDEYASHGATVLSTRFHGTITTTIGDDGAVTIVDRNGTTIGSLPAKVVAA